jgi:hypothetical protein
LLTAGAEDRHGDGGLVVTVMTTPCGAAAASGPRYHGYRPRLREDVSPRFAPGTFPPRHLSFACVMLTLTIGCGLMPGIAQGSPAAG